MKKIESIDIEDIEQMSEGEKLTTYFLGITNKAIQNLENELEVAKAMRDEEAKKLYHIQIGMFRHTQEILGISKRYALGER
ncbi:MAG TPA: hypothetical protein ENJ56_04175 [Anaerolineae bacterium]|nr:hypothetical protein [Anaerolineae bacterium]